MDHLAAGQVMGSWSGPAPPAGTGPLAGGKPPNFYAAVYRLVVQIPAGKVTTYGQIARWLGHPSAARAVGYALHALPTGSDIPWQRVINAAGRISSRCDRHYEAIQRALLEAEGVRFDTYGNVDLRRFGWPGPAAIERDQYREAHQPQETHQPIGQAQARPKSPPRP